MANNRFGIPSEVLAEIRARDKSCVYCHKTMIYPYLAHCGADCATIEHLNCDPPYYWNDGLLAQDIVICCGACNSSRGAKTLAEWFKTRYCIDRNINENTVAAPVRSYLQRQQKKQNN
jgi:hypothetical protein